MGEIAVEVCEKLLQSRVGDMFQDEEFNAFPRLRAGNARRKGEELWAVVDFGGNGGRMHWGWCKDGRDQGPGIRDQDLLW